MGTKGLSIVGVDVKELLTLLNKALADEWLAYYQYWVGAKVVKGLEKDEAVKELTEHAMDELRHAGLLADRILQLGGTPVLDPSEWQTLKNCAYEAPTDFAVKKIVEQNIRGEQCAIGVYKKLVDLTRDKDDVTYGIALEILKDEVEHEDDLENLLEDLG